MATVTEKQFGEIFPFAKARIQLFSAALNAAMEEFAINTTKRQAAFLAQIGHESGELRYTRELASGSAYEGRKDLGNINAGDGVKFKGRGLIQITGRSNYEAVKASLGIDCIANPDLLEAPALAARSAAWWWANHGLNELADAGEFDRITRRINGGTNGAASRNEYWARAKKVLAC